MYFCDTSNVIKPSLNIIAGTIPYKNEQTPKCTPHKHFSKMAASTFRKNACQIA
jgi:hypothetical protein